MLTSERVASAASIRALTSTLSAELRREEARCKRLEAEAHHLRSSAEAQAATAKEVLGQLELTRSAVEGTQAAARRIVDDHERDVGLLMGELRSLIAPESAAAIESRLSASLEVSPP
jgi:hypothetical protein